MTEERIDEAKAEAVAGRLLEILNSASPDLISPFSSYRLIGTFMGVHSYDLRVILGSDVTTT